MRQQHEHSRAFAIRAYQLLNHEMLLNALGGMFRAPRPPQFQEPSCYVKLSMILERRTAMGKFDAFAHAV